MVVFYKVFQYMKPRVIKTAKSNQEFRQCQSYPKKPQKLEIAIYIGLYIDFVSFLPRLDTLHTHMLDLAKVFALRLMQPTDCIPNRKCTMLTLSANAVNVAEPSEENLWNLLPSRQTAAPDQGSPHADANC